MCSKTIWWDDEAESTNIHYITIESWINKGFKGKDIILIGS